MGIYESIEDGYYSFMDFLDKDLHIPVYDLFVAPVEKKGIPSFPVFAIIVILLLSLIGGGAYMMLGQKNTSLKVLVLSGDNAVPGAKVKITADKVTLEAIADEDGYAIFPKLPVGKKYTLIATAENYKEGEEQFLLTKADSREINLEALQKSISMKILVLDDEGSRISGAVVRYISGSETGSARTDSKGNAYFTLIEGNAVDLEVSKEGFDTKSDSTIVSSQEYEIMLRKPRQIPIEQPRDSGKIRVKVTDESDKELEATVKLFNVRSSGSPIDTQTTVDGAAVFYDIEIGTNVKAVASARGYVDGSQTDTIKADSRITIRLKKDNTPLPRGKTSITVKDGVDKKAISGATVTIFNEDNEFVEDAKTGSSGEVQFDLRALPFLGIIEANGYAYTKVLLLGGDVKEVTLFKQTDAAVSELSIHVEDEDKKLITGALITLFDEDGDIAPPFKEKTNAKGDVKITLPNQYFAVKVASGALFGEDSIELMADSQLNITLYYPTGTLWLYANDIDSNYSIIVNTTNSSSANYRVDIFDPIKKSQRIVTCWLQPCQMDLIALRPYSFNITALRYYPTRGQILANEIRAGNITSRQIYLKSTLSPTRLNILFEGLLDLQNPNALVTEVRPGKNYAVRMQVYFDPNSSVKGIYFRVDDRIELEASGSGSVNEKATSDGYISSYSLQGTALPGVVKGSNTYVPDICSPVDRPNKPRWIFAEYSQDGMQTIYLNIKTNYGIKAPEKLDLFYSAYSVLSNGTVFSNPIGISSLYTCPINPYSRAYNFVATGGKGQKCSEEPLPKCDSPSLYCNDLNICVEEPKFELSAYCDSNKNVKNPDMDAVYTCDNGGHALVWFEESKGIDYLTKNGTFIINCPLTGGIPQCVSLMDSCKQMECQYKRITEETADFMECPSLQISKDNRGLINRNCDKVVFKIDPIFPADAIDISFSAASGSSLASIKIIGEFGASNLLGTCFKLENNLLKFDPTDSNCPAFYQPYGNEVIGGKFKMTVDMALARAPIEIPIIVQTDSDLPNDRQVGFGALEASTIDYKAADVTPFSYYGGEDENTPLRTAYVLNNRQYRVMADDLNVEGANQVALKKILFTTRNKGSAALFAWDTNKYDYLSLEAVGTSRQYPNLDLEFDPEEYSDGSIPALVEKQYAYEADEEYMSYEYAQARLNIFLELVKKTAKNSVFRRGGTRPYSDFVPSIRNNPVKFSMVMSERAIAINKYYKTEDFGYSVGYGANLPDSCQARLGIYKVTVENKKGAEYDWSYKGSDFYLEPMLVYNTTNNDKCPKVTACNLFDMNYGNETLFEDYSGIKHCLGFEWPLVSDGQVEYEVYDADGNTRQLPVDLRNAIFLGIYPDAKDVITNYGTIEVIDSDADTGTLPASILWLRTQPDYTGNDAYIPPKDKITIANEGYPVFALDTVQSIEDTMPGAVIHFKIKEDDIVYQGELLPYSLESHPKYFTGVLAKCNDTDGDGFGLKPWADCEVRGKIDCNDTDMTINPESIDPCKNCIADNPLCVGPGDCSIGSAIPAAGCFCQGVFNTSGYCCAYGQSTTSCVPSCGVRAITSTTSCVCQNEIRTSGNCCANNIYNASGPCGNSIQCTSNAQCVAITGPLNQSCPTGYTLQQSCQPICDQTCVSGVCQSCVPKCNAVCSPQGNICWDADGDGYNGTNCVGSAKTDCNDANSAIKPGATEICTDSIDNNCNGVTNENPPCETNYVGDYYSCLGTNIVDGFEEEAVVKDCISLSIASPKSGCCVDSQTKISCVYKESASVWKELSYTKIGSLTPVTQVTNLRCSNDAVNGTISASSTPVGAQIFVDGISKGFAPLEITKVPPGSHIVGFKKAGYTNQTRTVTVVAGQAVSVSVSLLPITDEYGCTSSQCCYDKNAGVGDCSPKCTDLINADSVKCDTHPCAYDLTCNN